MNVRPATVSVPDRWPPVVDAALKPTVPGPEPLAPDVTVSQEALLVAVHEHPPAVATSMLPVPPLDGTSVLVGVIEKEQPPPLPCWFTVKVCPPIVTVDERAALVGATVSLTVPSPEPLDPEVTVIQLALLVAVQAQPAAAITLTVASPPAASNCCPCDPSVTMQPADCETASVTPPTLIVPLRAGPDMGATEKLIAPFPVPDVAPVRVIHDASLAALQAHPGATWIVELPAPP